MFLQKGTIAFDYPDKKYGIKYFECEYIDKNNVFYFLLAKGYSGQRRVCIKLSQSM